MSMGGELHSSDPRVGEKAVLDVFPSRKGALEALIVGVSSRRGEFIPLRESFKPVEALHLQPSSQPTIIIPRPTELSRLVPMSTI